MNFLPAGSAFPLLTTVSTVQQQLAPITRTATGRIADELQSIDPNSIHAALPSMGITADGSVGQLAQTPEGNITVPTVPAMGATPGEALYSVMGTVTADASTDVVTSDWRTIVRNEASAAANRASPLGDQWAGYVRALVAITFAASRETAAQLLARVPSEPFYTGFWNPGWPGSALTEARTSIATIRAALTAARTDGVNWSSALSRAGVGVGLPTGDTASELVDSIVDDLPGGTVSDGSDEDVVVTSASAAPSTPPWVWAVGGAVALAVVGLGVAAATRRR